MKRLVKSGEIYDRDVTTMTFGEWLKENKDATSDNTEIIDSMCNHIDFRQAPRDATITNIEYDNYASDYRIILDIVW